MESGSKDQGTQVPTASSRVLAWAARQLWFEGRLRDWEAPKPVAPRRPAATKAA